MESGLSETLDEVPVPKRVSHIVGVIPGGLVTVHQVALPARTRAKALASAPYALEDRLATDTDDLVFSILDWKSGEYALVSVVEKAYVEELQNALAPVRGQAELLLVPEFLLLPLHPQASITVAKTGDSSYVLRTGAHTGTALDHNSLAFWWDSLGNPAASIATNDKETARQLIDWGGTAVSEWDVGTEFEKWLEHGITPVDSINVVQNATAEEGRSGSGGFSRAAVLIFTLGLLAKVGLDLYENYQLHMLDQEMDREIVSVFQSTFPEIKRIVNPRLQMEQLIRGLRAGSTDAGQFQALLASVASAVPKASATLNEVTYRENTMTITCTIEDFAALDRLKKLFEEDESVRADLISSGSRDRRVSARFELKKA